MKVPYTYIKKGMGNEQIDRREEEYLLSKSVRKCGGTFTEREDDG